MLGHDSDKTMCDFSNISANVAGDHNVDTEDVDGDHNEIIRSNIKQSPDLGTAVHTRKDDIYLSIGKLGVMLGHASDKSSND